MDTMETTTWIGETKTGSLCVPMGCLRATGQGMIEWKDTVE